MTAATASSLVQLMPRLTHHSIAQPMITGTMISSCNGSLLLPLSATEPPIPMPMPPPIFTQVSVPSTLTKPAPYAAQELPARAPLVGSSLSGAADGFVGF